MHQNPAPPPLKQDMDNSQWDPLEIALVGTICGMLLIFSYFRILRRKCYASNLTSSRNQTSSRRRLNEDNPDDPSLQFQSRGLDSFVMHSLPITQFKVKADEAPSQPSYTDCAVCLGEFEEGEWIKHLPNCSHVFHVSCIDTWFQTHSSCPLCRSQVYDLSVHHEYSIAMFSSLETLRREDYYQERSAHYQILRWHILQSSPPRLDP